MILENLKNKKKNIGKGIATAHGITLIALVLTIIVLIILASVAISLSLQENGIFRKAQQAKEEYANAQDYEEIEIAKAVNEMDKHVDGNRDIVTIEKEEYEKLKKKGTIELITSSTSTTSEIKNVQSMEEYNKFYLVTEGNTGNILATSVIPRIVFIKGTLNYSSYTNDKVYAGFATYINDTSVNMYCLNAAKVELYGEY